MRSEKLEGLGSERADREVGGPGAGCESLSGAGPAGWLRESGSRLPQSKGLRPGRVGEGLWGDKRWDAAST